MLHPETLDALDGYWAAFLGVPRTRLRPPRPIAVPHAGLGDYAGMYAQAFGGAAVVSLPMALLERLGPAVTQAAQGGLADDGRWQAVFGERMDRVVGPALIAYADAGTFRPPLSSRLEVRPLEWADRAGLDAMRRVVTPEGWEHGRGDDAQIGVFVDGVLGAVASYEVWDGRIAHLSVVTHPAHRGHGLGTAAVAHATRTALDRGLIAQYRALASNTHSIGISRRLGFVPYAASLAVRLHLAGSDA